MQTLSFCSLPTRRHGRTARGFTLVEALVSLAVLVITSVGCVSGFMLLNRFASDNRDRSAARELCQERIEQALTMPFSPKNGNYPAVVGQDGNTYYLLGQASDYNTSTNAYTGAAGKQTSSTANASGEAVTVYKQPNGTKFVTGFRTTSITNTGVANLIQLTVTVNYTLRGQPMSYTLYTLRGPD